MKNFSQWTDSDVAALNRKMRPGTSTEQPIGQPVTVEKDLHNDIIQECRKRGWIALHGRMDASSGRTLGEFDFVIIAEHPKIYFVECKTMKGKLSPDQLAMHAWAAKLGWSPHVIRSMDAFLSLL